MKHIGLVLAALIVVTACTSSKSSTATPTSTVAVTTDPTTAAPSTTTTTTVVSLDPSMPPPVVDVPYLTAVMAKLRMLDLQHLAVLQRDHQVTHEVIGLLHAEYSKPEFDNQVTRASDFLLNSSPNLRPITERGPLITTPQKILTSSATCISFIATEDFSQEAATAVPVRMDLIVLGPINRADDPERLNVTPWQISFAILPNDVSHPTPNENLCLR